MAAYEKPDVKHGIGIKKELNCLQFLQYMKSLM